MTSHRTTALADIPALDLADIAGGAALDFTAIRQQAQGYCPITAAKYGTVNPASVTRPLAQRMGNECLAEMSPLTRALAQGPIHRAIDAAFPPR